MSPRPFIINAWIRLLFAFLVSFILSFATGVFLIAILNVAPERLFEISSKRLSFVYPVMQSAATLGLDQGLVLSAWNTLAAFITVSFLYTAPLFNPRNISLSPRNIRKIFCGSRRMKLLCFLPGCRAFTEESLRRVYVWLMIPWLGIILLGVESGLGVSTSVHLFGSYFVGFLSLLPHGIIEIPAFAFAGSIPFGAHLLLKKMSVGEEQEGYFTGIDRYRAGVPLWRSLIIVMTCLLIAGLIEAHVTLEIVSRLQQ